MIGVLLLNMGGPDSLKAVKPFLHNLFADRDIIRLGPSFLQKPIAALIIRKRLKSVINAYSAIGGKSPLLDITNAQASALEESLNSSIDARRFRVYVGMRYWHPFVEDAVDHAVRDGINRVIALSLYPHYSTATTGSSVKKFEDSAKKYHIDYLCITSWFNNPLYIDAIEEKIRQGLAKFKEEKPVVLFSAHSLPKKFVDEGDPYADEIQGTINEVLRRFVLSPFEWRLSYQSKTGPVKWLEPSTEDVIRKLSKKGIKNILVVPISFVSDHIETLYEIDIQYKDMAGNLGINLKRTESLNTSTKFIEALSDIVIKNAKDLRWI